MTDEPQCVGFALPNPAVETIDVTVTYTCA